MKTVIRADAYSELGTGHLMRCLALAQGLKYAGGSVSFIVFSESNPLLVRIRNDGFPIHALQEPGSIKETLSIIKKDTPDWLVLDGYHFDTVYQKAIKDIGLRLLVVDDYAHLGHYHADMILNQNYGAENYSYSADPGTKFLLGPGYALLRSEFLKHKGKRRETADVAENLLITLGGADFENQTLKVLKAACAIETPLNMKVIIGASNPHHESIIREACKSVHDVEVLISIEDMAPLMAWADAAVSAGGSTTWELLFMGVPSLLCITAENQRGSTEALQRDGVAMSIGWIKDMEVEDLSYMISKLISDRRTREQFIKKGTSIVDGEGSKRIVELIKKVVI